jgi:flagellar basal-body rod modification protein FlgD
MQIFANPVSAPPFAAQQPADTGSTQSNPDSTDSSSATITANDFLQLLVTEMQNQDPTADTDPNEYINQLVQVNSLEQLISINQDLSGLSPASGSSGSSGTGDAAGAGQPQNNVAPAAASGNLSPTDTGGRASRIASALGTAAQTLAPGSAQPPFSSAIGTHGTRGPQARSNVSNPAHTTRAE